MNKNSWEALSKIKGHVGKQQWQVFSILADLGPMTRKQLERATGLGTGSVNPRVLELPRKTIDSIPRRKHPAAKWATRGLARSCSRM